MSSPDKAATICCIRTSQIPICTFLLRCGECSPLVNQKCLSFFSSWSTCLQCPVAGQECNTSWNMHVLHGGCHSFPCLCTGLVSHVVNTLRVDQSLIYARLQKVFVIIACPAHTSIHAVVISRRSQTPLPSDDSADAASATTASLTKPTISIVIPASTTAPDATDDDFIPPSQLANIITPLSNLISSTFCRNPPCGTLHQTVPMGPMQAPCVMLLSPLWAPQPASAQAQPGRLPTHPHWLVELLRLLGRLGFDPTPVHLDGLKSSALVTATADSFLYQHLMRSCS